ncbi:uncharacterized protein Z518_07409 [Rhinocladiella mackenziei CBS 650.93]|uniref:AB hydrolase-1 domain-containing protein n=1 Tax=Rhinocladiella mackenziei CBS 650.93 TaxID=1442369 RepID=A0A0D2IKY0_9EURO|nr:uncharacterized protein Z518_07409 [Rhinocladiella mackenziei CBS 650.93]KIX03856.1 hypothetical protein Z518_07409 [Rhinocladiella mackenziei CBS 650.93]
MEATEAVFICSRSESTPLSEWSNNISFENLVLALCYFLQLLNFAPSFRYLSSIYTSPTCLASPHWSLCLEHGTLSNPSATFLDDVQAVRNSIVAETTQEHDVVVVIHSYGGQVGASAIKGLTRNKQDGSSSGNVFGLVLMATGFVLTGVCFVEGAGGKPPPSWETDMESGFALIVAEPRERGRMLSRRKETADFISDAVAAIVA